MPSNHLILCCPLILLPSIFPSIRVFSNESALRIRWPKYWSFSFNISPSKTKFKKFLNTGTYPACDIKTLKPSCEKILELACSLEKTLRLGKIERKGRKGQQRMRWLYSITNSMDFNLSKLWEIMKGREDWHVAVHGRVKSCTWLRDWTTAAKLPGGWKATWQKTRMPQP